MSSDSPDPSIDARLRQVPLPAGLLARLRETPLPVEQIDEALRTVALPQGLRESLRAIPADVELDRRLRAVACPQPLKARLKEIIPNEALDDRLRDVPYPAWLAVGVRAVWQVPRKNRTAQWAQALALMLLVGVSYALGMSAMLYKSFQAGTQASELASAGPSWVFTVEPATPNAELLAFELPRESNETTNELPQLLLNENALAAGAPLPHGTADEVLRAESFNLLNRDIISFLQRDLLGQPLRDDDVMPELTEVRLPTPRGIEPPLFRGFDRDMLLVKGIQPTVTLNENAALNRSLPPLWTDSAGYQQARSEILAGVIPDRDSIHPEDFLAAGDYEFPQPAPGQLALRTAAGPAVFGNGQSIMLLVGVQAGRAVKHRDEPAHIVVAIDTSKSMGWGDRLEQTRQALRLLVLEMRPEDRLSLVSFSEQIEVLLEATAPSEREQIFLAIDNLELGESTHVVAGLQQATSLAMDTTPEIDMALEVVLITDGLGDLPSETREAATQMMKLAADSGVGWTVLDLGRPGHASRNLETLATAAGGRYWPSHSSEEIGWDLIETLLIGSRQVVGGTLENVARGGSLVAKNAQLGVEFNPASVLRYRLVGHVPGAAGFQSAEPASLRGGQTAVALYEVWLKPGSDTRVATATLTWNDATETNSQDQTEAILQRKQDISRVQVALSPESSAFPLVTAQVLAEMAELLSLPPNATQENRSFTELLTYAQSVNPRLRSRASYERTLELIRAASAVRAGS